MTTSLSNKKRRLSPTASSRSSTSTPVPAPLLPTGSDSLSALPDFTTTTASSSGLAGPGPSTLEHQAAASAQGKTVRADVERRQFARVGTVVAGSGEGTDSGEECFLWTDIPVVKNFRYAPCSLSPNPSPHPLVPFHRTIPYPSPIPPVHISWLDRSAFLRLSPTALTMTNDRTWYYEVLVERGNGACGGGKGTGSVDLGNAHVRIGWGRRECNIDGPVGSDGYSYAIRDVGGEKVHLARPKPYGRSFATGDIIGCLITLPKRPSLEDKDKDDPATIKRQRRYFNYKGQSYFEMAEYTTSREMDAMVDREGKMAAAAKAAAEAEKLGNGDGGAEIGNGQVPPPPPPGGKGKKGATTKNTKKGKKEADGDLSLSSTARLPDKLEGSSISFFLNGEPLGEAFKDLYDFTPLPPLYTPANHGKKGGHHSEKIEIMHDDGTMGYYPMLSCFGKGKLSVNFGPTFAHPLPSTEARPMVERWAEFREEERKWDERDEEEDTKRLLELMREEEEERKSRGDQGMSRKKKGGMKKKKVAGAEQTPIPEERRGATATPAPSEAPVSYGDEQTIVVKAEQSAPQSPAATSEVEVQVKDEESSRSDSRAPSQSESRARSPSTRIATASPSKKRTATASPEKKATPRDEEGQVGAVVKVEMQVDGEAVHSEDDEGTGSEDGQEGVRW
ncbi:hypothetical protein CI109_101973 [Kwoniella shandongensis]|uniref:Uncharacterized protein n=1 Tax=Kwoniella shandongensis TaxID=1734106 RepID=A0A5M6BVG9_9TREE|nr:uncharacterized protein CI109_005365 [Kwoniella shandongensis]KAA5526241.1 hypothetical protein CI109_005365 [Kwoniella shandongensis]